MFLHEFHCNGKLVKCIHCTFIALIPKIQRVSDYRPISLVRFMYKVLAKVLSNMMRNVISIVISESRSSFVHRRQILDGILIANEVVDNA